MAIVGRTGTVNDTASATSITGILPTDRQAGDITIVSFHMGTTVANFTGPGGSWTQMVAPTANAANEIVAVYYQFDPGTAPVGSTSGAATRQTCICQAYGGVDSTTPVDVAAAITTAAGTPLNVAQITTVTNGARLISGATVDATNGTWTIPGTMTLVKQHTAGTGRGGAVADEVDAVAGATGTRTWQWSGPGLAMVGYLAALRPAADAPPEAALVVPPAAVVRASTW